MSQRFPAVEALISIRLESAVCCQLYLCTAFNSNASIDEVLFGVKLIFG